MNDCSFLWRGWRAYAEYTRRIQFADMDEGTMRRFVDYLLGQQEDLRLEVKAIRKLLEESESDKRTLLESLEKANERMGTLSEQLKDALRSQRKSERQAQKYRELWEREKRERYGKGRGKVSATVAQDGPVRYAQPLGRGREVSGGRALSD